MFEDFKIYIRLNEMSKKDFKFPNFISYAISISIGEHHLFSYDWIYGFHD